VNWLAIAGLGLVVLTAGMMLGFAAARGKVRRLREIRAFSRLHDAIGRAVEEGGRLHISAGRGGVITPQSASTLAALILLRRAADLTSAGDRPPMATSGESLTTLLSDDLLRAAYRAATGLSASFINGRLSGLTPFSYAAGALPVIYDESVSANILLGHFGLESALLTDAAERKRAFTLAGSDSLPAQAVLYATAEEPLLGEDIYAAPAYLHPAAMHLASLRTQDVLRWLIIGTVVLGALLKAGGLL
jgi:hypothetical protein